MDWSERILLGIGAVVTSLLLFLLILGFVTGEWKSKEQVEFAYRDRLVQECLRSERYTRDECIILAGER